MDLTTRTCTDLPKGSPALDAEQIAGLRAAIAAEWEIGDGELGRRWTTRNFAAALDIANRVGALAEAEGHHPDITLGWGYCSVRFSTHSVGGLSENDFICAAKLDRMELGG